MKLLLAPSMLLLFLTFPTILNSQNDSNLSVFNNPHFDSTKSHCSQVRGDNPTKEKNKNIEYPIIQSYSGLEWINYTLPILTLLLGIGLNKVLDYWSNKRRLRKVLRRWAAEIRCLEGPMNNQIAALEKFISEHNEESFEFPNPVVYSILDCSIFGSLDKGELVSAIQTLRGVDYNEAVSASNSINGFISIQIYTYEVLKEKFNEYKDESSKHINSFNQNLRDLLRSNAQLGVDIEKEIGSDPINNPNYKAIYELISTHVFPNLKDGRFNPFQMDKNFFKPLLIILSKMRLDERVKPITEYTSNCLTSIQYLRMERVYVIENMNHVINNYKEQLEDFDKVVRKIEVQKN